MTLIARKYNPGFLTDEELMASFCVRTREFESILEMLRECTGPSNPHQIVIGPRGSGKTSLLLRVAAEIRRDPKLSRGFFPAVFAEESYEVDTAGEFWLEALSRLADQTTRQGDAPDLRRTFEDLRTIQDDRTLGERCLGALLDFSDREGKRLVLMVENLGMMFKDMSDSEAGWRLRKVLQTEPRIILLASATSRFEEIDHPDHALYDLFRVHMLRPLDTNECAVLWGAIAGKHPPPETIRSLEILTGGSPRLVAIVARFGAARSFRQLMDDLLDLVDDHTEYFKSHIESLPAQERRVYLALADLWKPATTREIAERTRIETSKCSAQLTRLTERGVVQVTGGSARRKQYYLTERLYNIYYLLRRNRGPDSLIEALIQFMESYYSPTELMEIGARIAREVEGFDAVKQTLHRTALARLVELPALAGHRDELLGMIPEEIEVPNQGTAPPKVRTTPVGVAEPRELSQATTLFKKAVALMGKNRTEKALSAFDELVRRFGQNETPAVLGLVAKALFYKGITLGSLNQTEEELAIYDELVQRFGNSKIPAVLEQVAMALFYKGITLGQLNQTEEELGIYDELVQRFGNSKIPAVLEQVAMALLYKGITLGQLNQTEEELAIYDELVQRFGNSKIPAVLEQVAMALLYKGITLGELNQTEEELAIYDELVQRFENSEMPALLEQVAKALLYKGITLGELNQTEEELAIYDELVQRFGNSEMPGVLEQVAKALVNKGVTLGGQNQTEKSLGAYGELVQRFGNSEIPALLEQVAKALLYKGITLGELNQTEEELTIYGELVQRFENSEMPAVLEQVAKALVNKGVTLGRQNQTNVELGIYDELVQRFGNSEIPALLEQVAKALVNKGVTLGRQNQTEKSLAAYGELVQRFGNSEIPALLEQVAKALLYKGITLGMLNQMEEALFVFQEVARRFGDNDSRVFQTATDLALLGKAEIELRVSRYEAAVETASRLLNEPRTESRKNRLRGHLIRARATLAKGDPTSCDRDIEAILAILPDLDSLPKEILDALMEFSIDLGQERMCEIIQASPSAKLLLPLTTALEQEIGREPRVAREVEEVARDIRQDLARLREARADGSGK